MEQRTATKIRIPMTDWQFNAGIVGFLNIMKHAGKMEQVEVFEQEIYFDSEILENFAADYFSYLIELYKPTTSWYKIVSFKEFIRKHEENEFEYFDDKQLEILNKYIGDIAKYYIKSGSYKAVYGIVDNTTPIEELGNGLQKIPALKKKTTFADKREEILFDVKDRFEKIKSIVSYFEDEEVAKQIGAKNVLYTIVKNGWDGVSALNPQTKEKDTYKDFYKYFIEPCMEYLEETKEQSKHFCSVCNEPIKNLDISYTFLVETGFDIKRKNSHSWNFLNDLGMCPVCRLIYSCVPAGFVYVHGQGMFINANTSIKHLSKVQNLLIRDVYKPHEANLKQSQNIYASLISSLMQQVNQKRSYELEDVQIVHFENGTYHFTLLPKRILKVLNKSKKQLDYIISKGFKEGNDTTNLYQAVIKRLFNSENLFTFIHKLLLYKATRVQNLYYGVFDVDQIIRINQEFLGGIGKMDKLSQDELEKIKGAGWHFRNEYKARRNERKVDGITYKLLNALKINNRDAFMDVLLNCYAYLGKQTPKWCIQIFNGNEEFKTIGYSFVAGIIGEDKKGGNE